MQSTTSKIETSGSGVPGVQTKGTAPACEESGTQENIKVAPIIDAEQAQNAARAASDEVRMIYDMDIVGSDGASIGVASFSGGACMTHPVMLSLRHHPVTITRHLSLDEAMGVRDALIAAIAALGNSKGALS